MLTENSSTPIVQDSKNEKEDITKKQEGSLYDPGKF